MSTSVAPGNQPCLDASHIEDLKLAASKLLGSHRRSFQAAMAMKYCQGNPRQAELVFGWSRHTVALGLHERRTGIICLGAQEACCGNKRWEERHSEAAAALRALAETHSQPDPTFRTTLYYTRLTAAEAIKQLRALGFAEEALPSPSTMAQVLNRNGYRLRPVLKAKPQKKSPRLTPSLPTSGNRTRLRGMKAQPNA
jgi:Rhodopirellula transposase DDE domain